MAFYVTTPIYYVNAAPHLGHAYTTIGADILARHHRQRGEDVFFLTGTDEHGEPVAKVAEARGHLAEGARRPQRAALPRPAAAHQRVQRLLHPHLRPAPQASGPGGHAARPRQRAHVQGRVRGLVLPQVRGLQDRGGDRRGQHVPDPPHPARPRARGELVLPAVGVRGAAQAPLRRAARLRARRRTRYNEALAFINGGLQDVSLSRAKLTWGVEVPWDPSHVFYVWFDALLNYYTALCFARDGEDLTDRFWPATLPRPRQGHPQVPRGLLAGDADGGRPAAARARADPRLPADARRVGRGDEDVQVARQRARPVRGHGQVRHRRAALLLLPRGLVRPGRRRLDDHVRASATSPSSPTTTATSPAARWR